jgi:hypothetical protein
MSTPNEVERLRTAARNLRTLAATIGASRALDVHQLAGDDTWIGPTPQACYDTLLTLRRQLLAAEQSSIDTARRLDRRADIVQQQLSLVTAAPL